MHSKGNHKQNEKTTTECEKIFENEAANKGLILKIYKQVIQFNSKKKKKQKWTGNLNRHVSKEEIL